MGYGFNDDKSKYDIDGVLSELESNVSNRISEANILTQTLTGSQTLTIGANTTKGFTISFTIPTGYIPISAIEWTNTNSNCGVSQIYLDENKISGIVYNTSSNSVSNTITIKLMCIKIDI